MVVATEGGSSGCGYLSVLALSSRFDGRMCQFCPPLADKAFSTRSVESF